MRCASLQSGIYGLDVCKGCKGNEETVEAGLPEEVAMGSLYYSFRKECARAKLNIADKKVQKLYAAA